jgi:hypothetical protein
MTIEEATKILQAYPSCKNLESGSLKNAAYHVVVNGDFIPLYISSAETYISLAIAALGLSVLFR